MRRALVTTCPLCHALIGSFDPIGHDAESVGRYVQLACSEFYQLSLGELVPQVDPMAGGCQCSPTDRRRALGDSPRVIGFAAGIPAKETR